VRVDAYEHRDVGDRGLAVWWCGVHVRGRQIALQSDVGPSGELLRGNGPRLRAPGLAVVDAVTHVDLDAGVGRLLPDDLGTGAGVPNGRLDLEGGRGLPHTDGDVRGVVPPATVVVAAAAARVAVPVIDVDVGRRPELVVTPLRHASRATNPDECCESDENCTANHETRSPGH